MSAWYDFTVISLNSKLPMFLGWEFGQGQAVKRYLKAWTWHEAPGLGDWEGWYTDNMDVALATVSAMTDAGMLASHWGGDHGMASRLGSLSPDGRYRFIVSLR